MTKKLAFVSGRDRVFLSSLNHAVQLWSLSSIIFSGYEGLALLPGVQGPGCEADHWPPSARVKSSLI
jgi:hypothetical protein